MENIVSNVYDDDRLWNEKALGLTITKKQQQQQRS